MKGILACVGVGFWGKNLARNFHSLGALRTICETQDSLRSELSAKYPDVRVTGSLEAVLQDSEIRAVAIATPAATHGAIVRAVLSAGKDVFVEKPLCLGLEEGRDLVNLAQEGRRILMVGHLLRYHPAVMALQRLVDDGELGRLQYVYSNRLNLGRIRREENILWSFAPHDLSVILGFLREMPEEVQAQGGNYLHPNIADVTVSLLSFPNGVRAHIFVSWLHPYKEQKLVVIGDRQMAVFDDLEEKDKLVLYPHSIAWKNQIPVANRAERRIVPVDLEEPLRLECQHFLECVESRRAARTDGEEALRVLTVLQQCQQALEKRAGGLSLGQSLLSSGTDPA